MVGVYGTYGITYLHLYSINGAAQQKAGNLIVGMQASLFALSASLYSRLE